MRSGKSETWLLLPLLPIFVVGAPLMLLFAFLGYLGVVLAGILLICVGLSNALTANSDFSQQVIVHGYARRSERAVQASDRHSAIRSGFVIDAIGVGLVIAGLCGFVYFS